MTDRVLARRDEALLEITLNRPDRLNAIDLGMAEELLDALSHAAKQEVRCLLLRAEGKAFCVGGDIVELSEAREAIDHGEDPPDDVPDALHRVVEALAALAKPVVAVVNGACAGAGLSLVLASDLALAADDARFSLAYAGVGLCPDGGATYFLPRHVGRKRLAELYLTGATIDATEALSFGFVNRVVPRERVDQEAEALARELARGPTAAFGRFKALLQKSEQNGLLRQLALESRYIKESFVTDDFREGIEAFLEKREPSFRGS